MDVSAFISRINAEYEEVGNRGGVFSRRGPCIAPIVFNGDLARHGIGASFDGRKRPRELRLFLIGDLYQRPRYSCLARRVSALPAL